MDYSEASAIRDRILEDNDPITGAVILGTRLANDPDFYAALHGRELAPGVHIQNPGPDGARMAEKLIRRAQGAAQDYVEGMANPRRDPVQAAVAASGKWANRVQEAIQQGAYAAGVRSQNYGEAVQIATADGGSAYTQGVAKRSQKIQRVMQRLAPLLGGVSQAIQRMPQDTDGQREARLIAARRAMIAVGKQFRGGGGAGGVG